MPQFNRNIIIAATSISISVLATVGQFVIYKLDQATAEQCREHAWPKNAHQIHMDWCIGNGYKI
jgi:hypothetical protein